MFFDLFLILYRNSAAVVCTRMLLLGIYGSTTSIAQHSAITPAQSSKPSKCGSEYISREACTYMHAAPGLFSWGIELLAFASHLFASKMLHHLVYLPFRAILCGKRSLRNRPLREAPYIRTWLYVHIGTCCCKTALYIRTSDDAAPIWLHNPQIVGVLV